MHNTSKINWKRLLKYRTLWLGIGLLLLITLSSLAAPLLTDFDPRLINAPERLLPPGEQGHPLGTDSMGRDLFSRILYGGRTSLAIGLSVVVITGVAGTVLGLICGYFPRVDMILMRVLDGLMAFPSIILAIALVAALGAKPSNTVIALSIVYIPRMARVVRSAVLPLRSADFVMAAQALGGSDSRIIRLHVLPNSLGPIIIQATAVMAYAILAEASLSFLGVSGSPETPSWGMMLNEARTYIRQAPWMSLVPGIWILVTVLSLNMVGDSLRDMSDPHLRRQ